MKTIVFSYDAEMVPFYYSGVMNAAAPEGILPRRISDKKIKKTLFPPSLGEAMRRVSIVFKQFSPSGILQQCGM